MKITKSKLQEIIREVLLQEGMKDDYKTFQQEVSTTQAGWKTRMTELDARQNSINSVRQAQTTIHELLEYFKETPVSEALGTVKKGNARKFEKALGVMESILEDTNGWLDENN